MQVAKLVAVSIPILTVAVWTYFFVSMELPLNRFTLVAVLVPLILASFYVAIKVWRRSKPRI